MQFFSGSTSFDDDGDTWKPFISCLTIVSKSS